MTIFGPVVWILIGYSSFTHDELDSDGFRRH